jgi:hypothetical protein
MKNDELCMPRWTKEEYEQYLAKQDALAWSRNDEDWLKANYPQLGQAACASRLKRSASSIRMKASRLGLVLDHSGEFFQDFQKRAAETKTGKKRPAEHAALAAAGWRRWWDGLGPEEQAERKLAFSQRTKERTKLHPPKGNPDGFRKVWNDPELRRRRREKSAEAIRRIWADPSHKVNSPEHKQKLSDQMSKNRALHTASNCFSRVKRGLREDLGMWLRSSWEANYARYLNFLIRHEGKIERWEYEAETFWFEEIKRGCRSYTPDFKVFLKDGNVEYHEVKGWFYQKSKTALKRMRIYHPSIQIVLIDQKRYYAIAKQCRSMIPNWENPASWRRVSKGSEAADILIEPL